MVPLAVPTFLTLFLAVIILRGGEDEELPPTAMEGLYNIVVVDTFLLCDRRGVRGTPVGVVHWAGGDANAA